MNRTLPRYEPNQTYDWNYARGAELGISDLGVRDVPGDWSYCGVPVGSPLGIAAGPLLNGHWCLHYASLGFDVLTYKTVRGVQRPSFPWPNLQPVRTGPLHGGEEWLAASERMESSWAVSFGMPSKAPEVWRSDVEWTRSRLPRGKCLAVSVVGTVQPDWTIDDLADDYARCARWAVESGADVVETNFSCPNVATCDGQLYQQPSDARIVAARVREAIGSVPLVVKVGRIQREDACEELLLALRTSVSAVAMTNSIATKVRATGVMVEKDQWMFEGQPRGICGQAIRDASIQQTRLAARIIARRQIAIELVGVGGVGSADDVRDYLSAGARSVHLATAAMQRPEIGLEIRESLAFPQSTR